MRRLPLRSPPRMRGKGIADDEARAAVGITPACAGKRMYFCCKLSSRRDHPRVCGEKYMTCSTARSTLGSPPRMRGKAEFLPVLPHDSGITPAYAGKSISSVQTENTQEGSPPRMRGKVPRFRSRTHGRRITPAYAGKRTAGRNLLFARWDHPRVCGEKFNPIA